jgi:radical SAM superfamily enzyme YgiQ (UPF0313 family)
MNKVLIISSSFEDVSLVTAGKDNPKGLKTTDDSHYPLGIAYLHSCLEQAGFEVKTLFLNNYPYELGFKKVKTALDDFSPDIVGFQILTANRISSFRLIEYINEYYPLIKQVIGGIHATILHEQLLNKYPFLIAVLGEGEITFPELIQELSKAEPELQSIDGIAFSRDGEIRSTAPRKLIENLDDLPFPKHELFFHSNRTSGNLLTSRGCPFNCSFCCLDRLSQRRVRKRSVENVIAEIEMMIEKFPHMTDIWIHDDTFFIDNQRVIKFCDEVIKRKWPIKFTCSGRVKPLSPELIEKLEQANFKKVLFGLESGDEGILKSCHKNITQADVINAFRLFSKSKIPIYAFLIVGLPGENESSILETAKLIQKLQTIKYVPYTDVAVLAVYPGTEVYEIAKTGGMIDDSFWLSASPTPLYTLENSQAELFRLKEMLLDRISIQRTFLPKGFLLQFKMLPYIIKYLISNPIHIKNLAYYHAKKMLPQKIYNYLKDFYYFLKN